MLEMDPEKTDQVAVQYFFTLFVATQSRDEYEALLEGLEFQTLMDE